MRAEGAALTGTLAAEASARFHLALSAGHTYAVVGLCDDDCHDLRTLLAVPVPRGRRKDGQATAPDAAASGPSP